jgi:hypothetical protein
LLSTFDRNNISAKTFSNPFHVVFRCVFPQESQEERQIFFFF